MLVAGAGDARAADRRPVGSGGDDEGAGVPRLLLDDMAGGDGEGVTPFDGDARERPTRGVGVAEAAAALKSSSDSCDAG